MQPRAEMPPLFLPVAGHGPSRRSEATTRPFRRQSWRHIDPIELAPTELAATLRPTGPSHVVAPGVRQRADVIVSGDGRMPLAPLLAVVMRELAVGAVTQWRCHADIEIACVALAGHLLFEPLAGRAIALGPEDVAVISTGARLDYRWRTVGDEPAHVLMFWFRARHDRAARTMHRREHRCERVGAPSPIAGVGTRLPLAADVAIHAGVLPIGSRITYDAPSRCYIVSSLGAFAVDGVVGAAGEGVLAAPGRHTIRAIESTEIVIVDGEHR